MRDAIVYSGSGWEASNVMERLAVALNILGTRVLYCDNPASRLKGKPQEPTEIEPGIWRALPKMFGHRLNAIRPLASLQSRMVANQIIRAAENLHLWKPIFFYAYTGRLLPVCLEMKRRGYFLVHVCMDYPELDMKNHVSLADLTLVIQPAALEPAREMSGGRAVLIPQFGSPLRKADARAIAGIEPALLQKISHPRLIYAGALQNRVLLPIIREILQSHPKWNFIHFGPPENLPLPNAHALPWMPLDDLTRVIANCDVGFMPYDGSDAVQHNVVPLKLFDYFAEGMPVISTPIVYMSEVRDVVYLGSTAAELITAIEQALAEPPDSPKRTNRQQIAREHSLENIAAILGKILPLNA